MNARQNNALATAIPQQMDESLEASRRASRNMLAVATVATLAAVGFGALLSAAVTAPLSLLAAVGLGASGMVGLGCGYMGIRGRQEVERQEAAVEDFKKMASNPKTQAALINTLHSITDSAPDASKAWQERSVRNNNVNARE